MSCGKSAEMMCPAKPNAADTTSVNDKFGMPYYYDFINTLKKQGFVFWDFAKFYAADKTKLPAKLIVIRHDIHGRDILGGIKANQIEKNLIGKRAATYFVQYDDPTESHDIGLQQNYLYFVGMMKKDSLDIQPHISINDLYLHYYSPSWENKSEMDLKTLFNANYEVKVTNDSSGIGTKIVIKTTDVMNLMGMNTEIIEVLKMYNSKWENATGLKAKYYASHGSHSPINLVLNNAVVLDQLALLHSGTYLFDTYNTWINNYLTYLSDNNIPSWIGNPSEVKPGRYQLLMHPYVWDNYVKSAAAPSVSQKTVWVNPVQNAKKATPVKNK